MKTIWQAVKSNVLFLANYRKEMRRLREEERTRKQQAQLTEIYGWLMLARLAREARKHG